MGQLMASDAMMMGRTTYENFASMWPRRSDPWADRINAMRKYVFSSKLDVADWNNSVLDRGDVVEEVTKLKEQDGGDLLVYGHGMLGETLLKNRRLDVLDVSIHPIILGTGKLLFREGDTARMTLVATKTFSKIVKLMYEPQY